MADPDWTDPCEVLTWLRPQYYKVAAGAHTVRVSYAGRDVSYNLTNIDKLSALIRELESQCAASQGVTIGRRRAIFAG